MRAHTLGPTDVVVVTRASGGVGRATARAVAERGAAVALLARGREGLEGAAADVRRAGGRPLVVPVDVADAAALDEAGRRVEAELGPVTVWVNVAFASAFARFEDVTAEEFQRATEVTYLGYVHGTATALRLMRPRGAGTVVQVGSALAYRGIPLQAAYCGAKHAIQGFTESLRCELLAEHSAIRVTMVQLPAVNTPQFSWTLTRMPRRPQPVPPIYQPEVAAGAVLYAAEHPWRREWWVGTSTMLTIAANAIVPGLLDRYLARTGFDSQQTSEPTPSDAPADLFAPADRHEDFGAHGRFDDRSHTMDPQLWASRHHGAVVGGVGAVAAGAWLLARRR